MTDEKCSALQRNPEFKAVADAIAPLLARGVRNITIWDGNHESAVPRKLFTDRGLCEEISRYGKPLYVFELPSPGINENIEKFSKATLAERQLQLERLVRNEAQATSEADKGIHRMLRELTQIHASGQAFAYDPDGRPTLQYTKGEEEQDAALRKLVAQHGISNVGEPLRAYLRSLNMQQLDDFESMKKKLNAAANKGSQSNSTDGVNRDIIRNVANYQAQNRIDNGVRLMLYGIGHFAAADDLNEEFRGVSVGVINAPGDLSKFYKNPSQGWVDVPDYAYYIKQQRFVKLDTPAAREEFTGMHGVQKGLPRAVGPQGR